MNKKNRIAFRVTDEEFGIINKNAKSFGLATGTYLRLLGVNGGTPYLSKELQSPHATGKGSGDREETNRGQELPRGEARIEHWKRRGSK